MSDAKKFDLALARAEQVPSALPDWWLERSNKHLQAQVRDALLAISRSREAEHSGRGRRAPRRGIGVITQPRRSQEAWIRGYTRKLDYQIALDRIRQRGAALKASVIRLRRMKEQDIVDDVAAAVQIAPGTRDRFGRPIPWALLEKFHRHRTADAVRPGTESLVRVATA